MRKLIIDAIFDLEGRKRNPNYWTKACAKRADDLAKMSDDDLIGELLEAHAYTLRDNMFD